MSPHSSPEGGSKSGPGRRRKSSLVSMVEDNLSSGHQAELLRLSLLKTGENTAVFALETYQNVVKASSLFSVISYFPSPRFLCFLTFLSLFFPFILKCTGASRRGVLDQFLGIGEPLSGGPPSGGAYWRTGSYPTPSTLDTRSLQCSSMKTTFLHIQLIYCKS